MHSDHAHLLVLLVEDEIVLLMDAAEHLRTNGFDVVEASSGKQAMVELSNGHSFDAVFTDISLGDDVTGWDVAEACRLLWPEIAVVYASGGPTGPPRAVEGSRFFAKPYQIEQVEAACCELCRC